MVFVTVGTHEQPFDRLIRCVDRLKGNGTISEDVIVQTGYSSYEPLHCAWQELFPYQEVVRKVADAHIVITHGGPSSFIMSLQIGKIPIVVPRQKQFGEHVNDHQVEFCRAVAKKQGNIILVTDIDKLKDAILEYDNIVKDMRAGIWSNNETFNEELAALVREMFSKTG